MGTRHSGRHRVASLSRRIERDVTSTLRYIIVSGKLSLTQWVGNAAGRFRHLLRWLSFALLFFRPPCRAKPKLSRQRAPQKTENNGAPSAHAAAEPGGHQPRSKLPPIVSNDRSHRRAVAVARAQDGRAQPRLQARARVYRAVLTSTAAPSGASNERERPRFRS